MLPFIRIGGSLILRKSVARGIGDLATFTVMLLTMIVGFALAGMLLTPHPAQVCAHAATTDVAASCNAGMNIFGQESDEYIDPAQSFTTLFLMVLGEFDFQRLYMINPIFAYFFFLFYQFFVFLIMVNIFLAILNDAYIAITVEFEGEDVDEGAPALTISQRIRKVRWALCVHGMHLFGPAQDPAHMSKCRRISLRAITIAYAHADVHVCAYAYMHVYMCVHERAGSGMAAAAQA